MHTEQVLGWSSMTDTEHATCGLNEEDHFEAYERHIDCSENSFCV